MILVTGGSGFIGSNFIQDWLTTTLDEGIVNIDALTYAGNTENLQSVDQHPRYYFIHGNITNSELINALLEEYQPRAVVHFAAESHVDRSILNPTDFINTNVLGTLTLLQSVRSYWEQLSESQRLGFRFLHVTTDEVYGSLGPTDSAFTESTSYRPNNPYSASKASSDHLVRAWHQTYGLPVLTTACSNNYGPYQFPEKLIPKTIANALAGKPLPIYGDGLNVRDWLYVGDHCSAVRAVLAKGVPGQVYNIGSWNEMTNIDIVNTICGILDQRSPATAAAAGGQHANLITFVSDRPGHDRRYAINANKIASELGWRPSETFATGIEKTVAWYLDHPDWVERVQSGAYRDWIAQQYGASAE